MKYGHTEQASALSTRIGVSIVTSNAARLADIKLKASGVVGGSAVAAMWRRVREVTGEAPSQFRLPPPPPDITAESLNCHYMPHSPTTLYICDSYSQFFLLPPALPFIFMAPALDSSFALAHSKANAMGSDTIPPWFSRLDGPFIAPTLAYIYNLSLRQSLSAVPVHWKIATITPVPKVAVPVKPADYPTPQDYFVLLDTLYKTELLHGR